MKKSILDAELTDDQLGGNIIYVKRHLRILLECELVFQSLRGNVRQYQSNRELLSL